MDLFGFYHQAKYMARYVSNLSSLRAYASVANSRNGVSTESASDKSSKSHKNKVVTNKLTKTFDQRE